SCSGCHRPEHAFSDGKRVGEGIAHQKGSRNTPSLLNVGFNTTSTWDGRHTTLESQALEPITNPREQGLRNQEDLIERIRSNPDYVREFARVFDVAAADIQAAHVARAITTFERTLVSGNSPVDRFLYGHDSSALSAGERRGLQLFRGAAHCDSCHLIGRDSALLTDNTFHNVRIGLLGVGGRLSELTERVVEFRRRGEKVDALMLSDPAISELSRFVVTLDPRDIGKFRTPSLRNVDITTPYMHDGSVQTLREAVDRELYDHS